MGAAPLVVAVAGGGAHDPLTKVRSAAQPPPGLAPSAATAPRPAPADQHHG